MKSFSSLIDKTTRTVMQQDRQIKHLISQIVPATTLAHIEFCRVEGGRLRLTVDNAVWVAKLRFSERQIIGTLKKEQFDVHTLSCHVAPADNVEARTSLRTPNKTSRRTAAALAALADQSADRDDDSLRQELLKLAETLRSRAEPE